MKIALKNFAMKVFTKKYAQEQGLENTVIQSLTQELDPLKVLYDSQCQKFEKVNKEQEEQMTKYLVGLLPKIKSNIRVHFDRDRVEIHVYEEGEESHYGMNVSITFIDEIKSYWDAEERAKFKVGDIERLSYSSRTVDFNRDGDDDFILQLDYLQVMGIVAESIKSNSELIQELKGCFMVQNEIRIAKEKSESMLTSITASIQKEYLGIIQSEVEMIFQEGISMWIIENDEDEYTVMNAVEDTTIYYFNSIKSKTCSLSRFEVDSNTEWGKNDKRTEVKYFRKDYRNSGERENIASVLERFPRRTINDDDMVIVLFKEDTDALLNVKDGNLDLKDGKPTAKGKEIIKKMQAECNEYSAYIKSLPKEKEKEEA